MPTAAVTGLDIPQLDGTEIVAKALHPAGEACLVFLTPADLKSHGQRVDHLDGPGPVPPAHPARRDPGRDASVPRPLSGPFDYHALADLAGQVVVADQQVCVRALGPLQRTSAHQASPLRA